MEFAHKKLSNEEIQAIWNISTRLMEYLAIDLKHKFTPEQLASLEKDSSTISQVSLANRVLSPEDYNKYIRLLLGQQPTFHSDELWRTILSYSAIGQLAPETVKAIWAHLGVNKNAAHVGLENQKILRDAGLMEGTESFKSFLGERSEDISMLLIKMDRGVIKTEAELRSALYGMGFSIGNGGYSRAFYGNKGGNWVFKLSHDPRQDKSFDYLRKVKEGKLWEQNSLFPRVRAIGTIKGESGTHNWAVLEHVMVMDIAMWDETARARGLHPQFAFMTYADVLAGRNVEDNPKGDKIAVALVNRFLAANNVDLKQFAAFVTWLDKNIKGSHDFQMRNMGLRQNGELVVFDPVS
jgi:hypothetical protein